MPANEGANDELVTGLRSPEQRGLFHDLRGTTVTLLSESGSTPQQIAPITGHSLKTVHRILERYLARTSGLAEQAIFNWENSERTKFANALTAIEGGKRGS